MIICTVAIYLTALGVFNSINKSIQESEDWKVKLKPQTIALWVTVIPMALMYGIAGVIGTLVIEYLIKDSVEGKGRINKRVR